MSKLTSVVICFCAMWVAPVVLAFINVDLSALVSIMLIFPSLFFAVGFID